MQSLDSDNYLSFQGQGCKLINDFMDEIAMDAIGIHGSSLVPRLSIRSSLTCIYRIEGLGMRLTWFSTKFKVFGSLKWPPVTHRP